MTLEYPWSEFHPLWFFVVLLIVLLVADYAEKISTKFAAPYLSRIALKFFPSFVFVGVFLLLRSAVAVLLLHCI